MKDYTVVQGGDLTQLRHEVQAKLEDDYRCTGGVLIREEYNDNDKVMRLRFYQAMEKYED